MTTYSECPGTLVCFCVIKYKFYTEKELKKEANCNKIGDICVLDLVVKYGKL